MADSGLFEILTLKVSPLSYQTEHRTAISFSGKTQDIDYRDLFRNNNCTSDSPSASFQAKAGACQASTPGQERANWGLQGCWSYQHTKHWNSQTFSGTTEGLESGQSAICLVRAEEPVLKTHKSVQQRARINI